MKLTRLDRTVPSRSIELAFYAIMIAGIAIFAAFALGTHGESLRTILFVDREDSFMDFFNPLNYVGTNPYERGDIYPPMAFAIYLLLSGLIPRDVLLAGGKAIRVSQEGLFAFIIYMAATCVIFTAITLSMKQGSSFRRGLFCLVMACSAPFAYQFERANIIFVALLFLVLFFHLKSSEMAWLREMAYISLAMAAAIKLYPAIFGLILIRERKWRESLRCALYGLLFFLPPFFLFNGLSDFGKWLHNLSAGISHTAGMGFGYQVSYANSVKILFASTGFYPDDIDARANLIALILLALSVIAFFFLKSAWKSICLLTLACVGFPSISYHYSAIFMVVPLILFLDTPGPRRVSDYLYMLAFAGILIPLPFWQTFYINSILTFYPLSLTCLMACMLILAMTIALISEGLTAGNRQNKAVRRGPSAV